MRPREKDAGLPAPPAERRVSETLAWLALIVTLLVPIGWGADGQFPWDNSIAPGAVLKLIASGLAPGHFLTYGPVPYYLMAIPYVPALAALKVTGELGKPSAVYPWGFAHPEASMTLLVVIAHLVTMALALGIAWMAIRREREAGTRHLWLVPVLLLGSPVFTYYGRTSNVDLHYLFWLWVAIDLVERPRATRLQLAIAGAAAAFAVCCKEQVAPAAAIAGLAATWRMARDSAGGAIRRLASAAIVPLAALAAYAMAWRLPWNLAGWQAHHEFIFGPAKYPRVFPPTPEGYLDLAARAASQLPLVLGAPMLAGLALALVLRVSPRGLGLRAAVGGFYLIGFIAVIGYVYPRFLMPLLPLALPLAVRGLDRALVAAAAQPFPRRALAAAAVILACLGGPLVGAISVTEPRYRAERWLRENLPPTATVEIAGNPAYQARVPRRHPILRTKADSLSRAPRGPRGDVVLVSSLDAYSFERDPAIRAAWWDSLHAEGADAAYRRIDFRLPPGAALIRGLEIPEVRMFVSTTLSGATAASEAR